MFFGSVPTLNNMPHNSGSDSTISWMPLSTEKSQILRIDSNLTMEKDYRMDITRFWNEEIPALLTSTGQKRSPIQHNKDEL